ncbi:MAG: hypothetical protein ACK4RZ_14060 [Paracoccaceae bacterium]
MAQGLALGAGWVQDASRKDDTRSDPCFPEDVMPKPKPITSEQDRHHIQLCGVDGPRRKADPKPPDVIYNRDNIASAERE